MSEESIRQDRIRKLEALKERGINPYPYTYPVDKKLSEIRKEYEDKIEAHEQTKDSYHVAGRIVLLRDMGGLVFMTIQDEDGKLQITFMKKDLGDKFKLLRYFDMGDIIGVYGNVFKTKKGELSILVKEFDILCKSLTDLGDKYHGLKDVELKYRNRSLDMVMNPESKEIIKKRFLITQKVREFMIKEGFLEIETPITQTVYGGAAAKPFKTYHNELEMDLFLRVAPEQQLKRVQVGGMEAVFEINKNFRNESIDRTHNPEFTMLEAYRAYVDYEYTMSLLERCFEFVALEVMGTTKLEFNGKKIDVKAPWKRVSVKDALNKAKNWDVDKMSDKELFKEVEKLGKQSDLYHKTRGEAILILFEEYGEPTGTQPTHFIDYPKESTVFCKGKRGDETLIERFESFICGMEVANAYSELNDPIIQRELLEQQDKFSEEGAEETWGEVDEDFLAAMDLGLPPSSGIGIGLDRMCMVLLNQDSIRDIIYFPTMKPKIDDKALNKKGNREAVALINKGLKLESWQEFNTMAHINAMFGARKGKELLFQDKIETKDGEKFNLNIQHAIMVKEIDSNKSIVKLMKKAKELEIDVYPFTREMIETTSDKKVIENTKNKKLNDIDFFGVLLFGDQKIVDKLTKEYKLIS